MKFTHRITSQTDEAEIKKYATSVDEYRKQLQNIVGNNDISSDEASLTLPFAREDIRNIEHVAKSLATPDLGAVVVLGVGGSSLGAWAVYDAIPTTMYPLLFLDTIDPSTVIPVIHQVSEIYSRKKHVVLVVISKSGQTTETIANYGVVIQFLKDYDKQWQKRVVVITDSSSPLWHYAKQRDFVTLKIAKAIGGRFSVFSVAGLFPLALAGIKISEFVEGARDAVTANMHENIETNTSLASACITYHNYLQQKTIHNMFLFASELSLFGQWYRQLSAESLAKDGKGITPIVSMGTSDLHSVLQLYIDGPKDKFTTFITVKTPQFDAEITRNEQLSNLVPDISGKKLSEIMTSIYKGVIKSYAASHLPFVEIKLDCIEEYELGYLLQEKMIETFYVAKLMGVHAFDQPGVENYKTATRELLKKA